MQDADELKRRNRAVAGAAGGIVVTMGGLVAFSPILYRSLSAYIGYGGKLPQSSEVRSLAETGAGKDLTVRFDTNVAAGLAVDFQPEARSVSTEIGRPTTLYYDVANRAAAPVVIRATFDVTPAWAAPYFFKAVASLHPIERLEPGEHARVPMVFYVDRRILNDRLAARVNAITLSYTFFRQQGMSDGALASVGDLATRAADFERELKKNGAARFANDAPSD